MNSNHPPLLCPQSPPILGPCPARFDWQHYAPASGMSMGERGGRDRVHVGSPVGSERGRAEPMGFLLATNYHGSLTQCYAARFAWHGWIEIRLGSFFSLKLFFFSSTQHYMSLRALHRKTVILSAHHFKNRQYVTDLDGSCHALSHDYFRCLLYI